MNQPTANPENKQPAPTSRQLPKAYEFREVEDRWYQNWLEHKNFLTKAPPEVVTKEQAKKDELMATLGTIEKNRRRLQAIV